MAAVSLDLLRIELNTLWTAGLFVPGGIAFVVTAATRRAAAGMVLGFGAAVWLRTGFPLIPFGAAEHAIALVVLAGAVLGEGLARADFRRRSRTMAAAACALAAPAVVWPVLADPTSDSLLAVLAVAGAGALAYLALRANAARPVAGALVFGAVLGGLALASVVGGANSLVVPPIALGAAVLGGAAGLALRGEALGPASLLLCGAGLAGFAAEALITTLAEPLALAPLPLCLAGLLVRREGPGGLARVALVAGLPALVAGALAYLLQ